MIFTDSKKRTWKWNKDKQQFELIEKKVIIHREIDEEKVE